MPGRRRSSSEVDETYTTTHFAVEYQILPGLSEGYYIAVVNCNRRLEAHMWTLTVFCFVLVL